MNDSYYRFLLRWCKKDRGDLVLFVCFELEAAYQHVFSPDFDCVGFWFFEGFEVCYVVFVECVYAVVSCCVSEG